MTAQFDGFEINPVHEGDAWKICNFMIANTDRLKRYFPKTLEQNLTPTLSQIFVEEKVKQFQNGEEFLFTLKELNCETKQGEYAYFIGYPFKGKGLITKTIKVLNEYVLNVLQLEILQIIVNKDNQSSIDVALNNGFKWQKTLLNGFTPPGESPLDMELYELYKN